MGKLRLNTYVRMRRYDVALRDTCEETNVYEYCISNMIICKHSGIRKFFGDAGNYLAMIFGPKNTRSAMRFLLKYLAPVIPAGTAITIPLIFDGDSWKLCMNEKMRMISFNGKTWTEQDKKVFSIALSNRFIMDKNEYALDHIIFAA